MVTLLLQTKVYEFLEVRVIEAAVRSFWLGKTNFSGSFMAQSTAYEMLFNHGLSKKLDSEALSREDTLSFNRSFVPGRDGKAHALSYYGIYSRMIIVYLTELLIGIILLGLLQYCLFSSRTSASSVTGFM